MKISQDGKFPQATNGQMSNGNSKENPDKEEEGEDTGEIQGGVGKEGEDTGEIQGGVGKEGEDTGEIQGGVGKEGEDTGEIQGGVGKETRQVEGR